MDLAKSLSLLLAAAVPAAAGWVWAMRRKTNRIAADAERLAPPAGRFVEANDRRFHVVERGEGPALLFVHGLGGNLHHFDVPLWPAMGEGYRMIAVDRRGSGWSDQDWADEGRITTHASDMAAVLDVLGIDKALWVGHSLGGAISLAAAVTLPDRVAGLALISPLTDSRSLLPPEFRSLHIASLALRKFICTTVAAPASIRTAEATLDRVFGPQKPPADFAVAGGALIGLRPEHIFAACTDTVAITRALPEIEQRYGGIAVPAGILFGDSDRVVDWRMNGEAMLQRLPGATLETLHGVGHMPQYAEPRQVAEFVRRMAARAFAA